MLKDGDVYFGCNAGIADTQWQREAALLGIDFSSSDDGSVLCAVSPDATLLKTDLVEDADDELLRIASINAGIGAGVITPDPDHDGAEAYFLSGNQTYHNISWIAQPVSDKTLSHTSSSETSPYSSCAASRSTSFSNSDYACPATPSADPPDCEPNTPRFPEDMYTPRWIRGSAGGM
ncbi:hypothetical protein GGI15_000936 [Coemansia interrupta]|uniref:Uncharacterized protein n=1 Tax=Coemansia interrupta TaxID=1126814 RepID=A0A9W8HKZ3_9FUNG|nr:hypothetical protein GGI15_000936 [Coemansia interrupta]